MVTSEHSVPVPHSVPSPFWDFQLTENTGCINHTSGTELLCFVWVRAPRSDHTERM